MKLEPQARYVGIDKIWITTMLMKSAGTFYLIRRSLQVFFTFFAFKLMLCDLTAEESCRFFLLACCLAIYCIYCVSKNCFSFLIRIIILKISSYKWLVFSEARFFYSCVFSFKEMTMDATVNFCAFLAPNVKKYIYKIEDRRLSSNLLLDGVWDALVYLKNAWDAYLLISWQGKNLLI